MIIQKLSWAGVAVSEGDTTVLIDPIGSAEHLLNHDKPLVGRMGEPLEELISLAVEAAKLLEAKMLLPIHYRSFHNPPFYRETPDPLNRTQNRANELSIDVKALMPGESLELIR